MSVHHGFDVWSSVTEAVDRSSGRVIAAVGYIGSNGYSHLPLKQGDVLVCDASHHAVRSGATNPTGLRQFLNAGVEVWSHEGLHAKVVVLPRRAFVGSQNASDHSAYHLLEAAIETTRPDEVRQLRDFVTSLGERELTPDDLPELERIAPARRSVPPSARRIARIPDDLDEMLILGFEYGDWSTDEYKVFEESRKQARSRGRRHGSGVRTEPVAVTEWVFSRVDRGDWIIEQSETHSYSPGAVVEKSRRREGRLLWLTRPTCSHRQLELASTPTLPRASTLTTLRGSAARSAADLFR